MKTTSKNLFQFAAFAALSMGLGLAQSSNDVKATIPFDFNVGSKTLPAGEYTITSAFGSPVLLVRDAQYHAQASIITMKGDRPAGARQSELVFRVHGTKHYLGGTWNALTGNGRELRRTPAEREVEMASGPTTNTVLIAHR